MEYVERLGSHFAAYRVNELRSAPKPAGKEKCSLFTSKYV